MMILCSFSVDPPLAGRSAFDGRTGEVLEQSDRGFFLASNTLYPPGTRLSLVLQIPGKRFPERLHGQVAWARSADRAGMFVELATAAQDVPAVERAGSGAAESATKPRGPALSS